MVTTVSTNQTAEQVSFKRLLWVALLTILAAITANFLIQQLAVAVLQPDPRFLPLTVPPPIAFTLFGVLGAVIVFALAGRFASRPISTF